jgi:hypothetical protein
MLVLIATALAVTGVFVAMRIYLKSHPPDVTTMGVLSLQRALLLGAVSSAAVLLLYIIMFYFPPVFQSRNLPLVLCAFAGNILNLAALADCLRELSGESLFAACFILLNQLLWIFYGLRVLTVDF